MKKSPLAKFISSRYIWSRKGEAFITILTFISVLGIAVGVMVLNIVMSIMNGFEHELKSKIVSTTSHIAVKQIGGRINNWSLLVERIRSVDGIKAVNPFTYNQALLRGSSGSTGLLIKGIPKGGTGELGKFVKDGSVIDKLFIPQVVEDDESKVTLSGIIIGRELSRTMGIGVGDAITLLSPQVSSTPMGMIPKFRRFMVVGIYTSGLVDYENGQGYISLEEAQSFFRLDESISGIDVQVNVLDDAPKISQRLMELSSEFPGIYTQDWTATNKPLWDALKLEKRVYFIVLLLIIVMASFSIVATLVMIVLEKRRDIAILKTLGAKGSEIGAIFRTQGAIIGGVGTLAGTLLGVGGCFALKIYGFPLDERIFQMSTVPVEMDPINFGAVGLTAFIISCIATIYPARRAVSLNPVEILRFE